MADVYDPNNPQGVGQQPVPTYTAPGVDAGGAQQPNYGYSQQPGYSQPQQQYVYQQAQPVAAPSTGWGSTKKDKWVAFVLAWLLGTLGIHKFYLGYKNEGIIMLVVSIVGGLCFGLGFLVMEVIAIIEGVRYIILTQEDFEQTYVVGRKGWL
ncbi:MAG: TM2 domain-containing protein [Coriobacteriales bacterium]|jgi:TM2 domain-containing membrane protein YozV|nr:TM2 domain-containing protein [Coriobacteriales bacterium]